MIYKLNIAIFHSYANLLKAILPRLHAGRFPAWFREGGEVGFGLVPEGSGAGSRSSGAGLCGEVRDPPVRVAGLHILMTLKLNEIHFPNVHSSRIG